MAVVPQSHRPAAPAVTGAAAGLPLRKLSFPALGTICEVQYVAPQGDVQATGFERAAVGWVNAFEAKYSRFRPDSLVSRINTAAGCEWVEGDSEMDGMLKLCETLFFMTQGLLDPSAIPVIQ